MSTRHTYNVLVTIAPDEDRVTVTVDGLRYRYPWHWTDVPRTMARRALTDHYSVTAVETIECHRRGVYRITAQVA